MKPSAAWVTDLTDKYRFNPFIRTATHVMVLQAAFALAMIGLFVWGVNYAQHSTVSTIRTHIEGNAPAATDLPSDIDDVRARAYGYALAVVVLSSILFSLLIARFALWPTRNSLQFQKRFIGNIAHEIRTPLAIIKTNTEVALLDSRLPASVRETFEETVVELDRISETINNLLSFDTLTRPRRMVCEPTDIGAIVETVLERHAALAESRGVALSSKIGDSRMVHGNSVALDQVVTNLVKNAINYTPKDQNGSVRVTIERDAGHKIALTVSDTGIGINEKDLFHIFEPFYRGDSSRARGVGTGTSGLGLAIVNEIVRLHKGSISIRSVVGHGTEFRITLPAAGPKSLPDPLESDVRGTANEISVDFS